MPDIFNNYSNLGARTFYCIDGNSWTCQPRIGDILTDVSLEQRVIDPVAVLGVLMKNYPIAVRTMVKDITRTPWLAMPDNKGSWEYADLPKHGTLRLSSDEIAKELKKRLYQEALGFVQGKNTIGILLSGGMDSRIVAAVIRQLQLDCEFTGQVIALTWGVEGVRDVVYSQRIAQKFGWDFIHFPLDAKVLHENIVIAGERGAEFSPVHLHAMNSISEIKGLDGILAGSYGDSIGRGEYSGRRTNQLPSILSKHLNHFAFLLNDAEKYAITETKKDLQRSRDSFPNRSEMDYREIEMQMHYMCRQLNSCMSIIDDKIPLYQMFGDPNVFGFMWSLDSSCRTDDIYQYLLKILPGNLLEIPWARTGRTYNQKDAVLQDEYAKLNNCYGDWLRDECRSFVLDKLCDGSLQSLGVFNEQAIEMWTKRWSKSRSPRADRLDEKMSWLASLAIFVDKYKVKGVGGFAEHSFQDSFREGKALMHTWLYHGAKRFL